MENNKNDRIDKLEERVESNETRLREFEINNRVNKRVYMILTALLTAILGISSLYYIPRLIDSEIRRSVSDGIIDSAEAARDSVNNVILPQIFSYRDSIITIKNALSPLNLSEGEDVCVLAKSCPLDWVELGTIGIIEPSSNRIYGNGASYSSGWHWGHPKLCCIR